jgi:hypothetical protein
VFRHRAAAAWEVGDTGVAPYKRGAGIEKVQYHNGVKNLVHHSQIRL